MPGYIENRVMVLNEGKNGTPCRLRQATVELRGDELVWMACAASKGFAAMAANVEGDTIGGNLARADNVAFHQERAQMWAEVARGFESKLASVDSHMFEARLRW